MRRLLLFAEIKENKVYFGTSGPFLVGGGQLSPYLLPRPPRRFSRGQVAKKISQGRGPPKFQVSGGSDPLRTPSATYMIVLDVVRHRLANLRIRLNYFSFSL